MDKKIIKLINLGSLSFSQLIDLAKATHIKLNGVYSIHDLPILKTNKNYIFLIHNKNETDGHFTAMRIKKNSCFYFDSFGVPCPNLVLNKLPKSIKNIYYNNKDYQNINEDHCGAYCLYFLSLGI